jgi:hypothetical protein
VAADRDRQRPYCSLRRRRIKGSPSKPETSNASEPGSHGAVEAPGTLECEPSYEGCGVVSIEPETELDTEHLKFAYAAGREIKDRVGGEGCVKDESRAVP